MATWAITHQSGLASPGGSMKRSESRNRRSPFQRLPGISPQPAAGSERSALRVVRLGKMSWAKRSMPSLSMRFLKLAMISSVSSRLRAGDDGLLAEDRLPRPLRRVGHAERIGADDVVDLDLAIGHVLVDVVGDLVPLEGVGRQIERVVGAAGVTFLMPTGAGDAASLGSDRAGQERQIADGAYRLVVDAPGGSLLEGDAASYAAIRRRLAWRSTRSPSGSSRPGRR